MKFIWYIIKGWWMYAFGKNKHLVAFRKPICDACEFKSKHNFCNDCGCFLPAKQSLEEAQCPKSKW